MEIQDCINCDRTFEVTSDSGFHCVDCRALMLKRSNPMNKLVAALEEITRYAAKGDYDFCGQLAQQALSEHRAEPSSDVVERVAMAIHEECRKASSPIWGIGFQKRDRLAKVALAAIQKGE